MSLSLFVGPDIDDPAASGVVSPVSASFMDRRRQAVGPTVLHQARKKKTTVGSFLSLAYDRLAGGSSVSELTKSVKESPNSNTRVRKRSIVLIIGSVRNPSSSRRRPVPNVGYRSLFGWKFGRIRQQVLGLVGSSTICHGQKT